MSDRLAQRLSAHRTAALQIEVARHPQVALAALVHGMVQTVLQGSHYGHDLPLGVSLKVQDRLEGMAPDWPESPAAVALRELQQVAGEALPEDSAELFAVLLAKSQDELVRLLACAWLHGGRGDTPRHAAPARRGTGAGRGPRHGRMVEADRRRLLQACEGRDSGSRGEFAPDHVTRLAKLKKADIASEAERLADGTGWMPAIFKAAGPQDAAEEGPAARRMPRQWRMNPPRRWPLDPHEGKRPGLDRGASLQGETP
jgi:ParB family chromosome partitioning protein